MIVGARIMFDRRATVLPGYTPSDIQKVDRTVPKHESSLQAMRKITYAPVRCVVVFVQQRFEGGWLDLCQHRVFVGETPLRTCWIAVPGSARVSRLHTHIYICSAGGVRRQRLSGSRLDAPARDCGDAEYRIDSDWMRDPPPHKVHRDRQCAANPGWNAGSGRMQRDRRSQRIAAGPTPRDRTRCTGATPRRAA